MNEHELRKSITQLVAEFYRTKKADKIFVPGETPIRYAGRVYDEKEIQAAVEASLDFWLTEGRFARQFETEFSAMIGVKHALLVNSGSSANLLAYSVNLRLDFITH